MQLHYLPTSQLREAARWRERKGSRGWTYCLDEAHYRLEFNPQRKVIFPSNSPQCRYAWRLPHLGQALGSRFFRGPANLIREFFLVLLTLAIRFINARSPTPQSEAEAVNGYQ